MAAAKQCPMTHAAGPLVGRLEWTPMCCQTNEVPLEQVGLLWGWKEGKKDGVDRKGQ